MSWRGLMPTLVLQIAATLQQHRDAMDGCMIPRDNWNSQLKHREDIWRHQLVERQRALHP